MENTLVFLILFLLFSFFHLKECSDFIKLEKKYEILVEQSSQFEILFTEERMRNHATANELIALKSMMELDKAQAIEYVDYLIQNNCRKKHDLLLKIYNLPKGGIQGLLYHKLLSLEENNISFCLEIDSEIKTSTLKEKNVKDFIIIVGLFFDDAIEHTLNKNISIHFFIEDAFFHFQIAYLTEEEDYMEKYVKEIIKRNKDLKIKKERIEDLFSKTVSISLK